MTVGGGGYQEPSGVFYSEMEPMRFLRLINFANSNCQTTDKLLSLSTVAQFTDGLLSQSAYRYKYYHYDEWQSRIAALSGVSNVASGILNWMRSEEPLYWYYYDLGGSGNYTRRIIKNVSFPFDDISTIPAGDDPLNYSFPLINSSGNRILEDASILLPFYQSAGLIEQIQSTYSGMFANPITNSVHPVDSNLSSIPVPAISKNIALQLNNLNLKPTDFISEYGAPKLDNSNNIIFPLNILPGSGFQPILDMAQQINYPREYITNINAIVPHNFNSISKPTTDCSTIIINDIGGQIYINYSKADYLISQIYFGFMSPSSINIQFSGVFPTYSAVGNEYDRFGNSRAALNGVIYPILTYELHKYTSLDDAYNVSSISDGIINTATVSYPNGGSQSYSINISGAQVGANTFNRYYDIIGDGNSDNSNDGFISSVPTTNYYLKNNIEWLFQYSGGSICLNTGNGYFPSIPYLSLDPANFNLSINDVSVPFTKYASANIGGSKNIATTNSPNSACFKILSGTVTINYTMPAINCKGYSYYIDKAYSNPGTSNHNFCQQPNGMVGFTSICTIEPFYRASKSGFCCKTSSVGFGTWTCTNVNDIGAAFTAGNCNAPVPTPTDCFVGFAPNLATFEIRNGCNKTVFSTVLSSSLPPNGPYNVWVDVPLVETINLTLGNGEGSYLNSWQDLTAYLTLTTESECVSLQLTTVSPGFLAGCFKNYPAGQIIDVHDDPQGPPNLFLPDSNDLTIFDLINGPACSGSVPAGENTSERKCVPYGFVCTDAGKTVNINSVVCNFIITCADGSTQNVSFTLPGGSATYPADFQTGCAFQSPTQTTSWGMGSAPAGCGWW